MQLVTIDPTLDLCSLGDRGSVWIMKFCPTLLHICRIYIYMISTGNRTPDLLILRSLSTGSCTIYKFVTSNNHTLSSFSGGSPALDACELTSGSASDIDHMLITGSPSLRDHLVAVPLREKVYSVNDNLPDLKKQSSEKTHIRVREC